MFRTTMINDMYVLGLSQHHDSAAALLLDGNIVAFSEEERFTRIKHDGAFPARAAQWCLESAGITLADVDHVAYFCQGRKELRHALGHFVRHLPATLAVFRNDGGDYAAKAASLRTTMNAATRQAHSDDYNVGGALALHVKRS